MPRPLADLSLRLRLALFFALIALGSAALLVGAGLFAMGREGGLWITVILGALGTGALTAWVALRFDEHVAKPIQHLSSELHLRAQGVHHGEVDLAPGQYLGALGPAVADANRALRRQALEAEDAIAAACARANGAVDALAQVLSALPQGVVAATSEHRITHLNAAALHLLKDEGPVGLDRSLSAVLGTAPLTEALAALAAPDADHWQPVALRTTGTGIAIAAQLSLLDPGRGANGGYVLCLPAASTEMARGVTQHDAGLLKGDRQTLACQSFVVFDTETTGLSPQTDTLVQLAATRIVNGRIVVGDVFDTLIDPGRPIPPASTAIHRIADADVAGAPKAAEALRAFHAWVGDATLIAHNAPFDMGFLRRLSPLPFAETSIDTVHLSALAFPHERDHTLDGLTARLGVTWAEEDRHTALGDARMTAQAFLKLLPLLAARGIETQGELATAVAGLTQLRAAQEGFVG
ncbi:MAG: 3'-5' exonuclease [Pseudomonadota bacterium]